MHFVTDLKWQLIKGKITRENEMKINEEELIAHTKDIFRQQFIQYYGIADVPEESLKNIPLKVWPVKKNETVIWKA